MPSNPLLVTPRSPLIPPYPPPRPPRPPRPPPSSPVLPRPHPPPAHPPFFLLSSSLLSHDAAATSNDFSLATRLRDTIGLPSSLPTPILVLRRVPPPRPVQLVSMCWQSDLSCQCPRLVRHFYILRPFGNCPSSFPSCHHSPSTRPGTEVACAKDPSSPFTAKLWASPRTQPSFAERVQDIVPGEIDCEYPLHSANIIGQFWASARILENRTMRYYPFFAAHDRGLFFAPCTVAFSFSSFLVFFFSQGPLSCPRIPEDTSWNARTFIDIQQPPTGDCDALGVCSWRPRTSIGAGMEAPATSPILVLLGFDWVRSQQITASQERYPTP